MTTRTYDILHYVNDFNVRHQPRNNNNNNNTDQNDVGRWELWSCDDTTDKKGHHFVAMTKKVDSFLMGKNRGDTVSCRPGWHQP